MPTAQAAFSRLGLAEDLVGAVLQAGYNAPTDIQTHGIPAFLGGRDVVFQAQTGTGKTAAFVLPILQQLTASPGKVESLVLTPTRELAHQVCEEFARFGADRGIHATAIYGGVAFQRQYDALETAQVVVATPGRLLDLIKRKKFSAKHVRFFGLDEADELLSMGFEKDVLDVISHLPDARQSFLCSATYNDAVQRVARNFVTDPVQVDVSSDQIGAQSVRHECFRVRAADKLDALRRLVRSEARTGAIVFANTRAATFLVNEALQREGVMSDVLNGELTQAEREEALDRMKRDEVQFLVATDVAARGIDISGLPAVVNYDMPESPDVYIHRTGRTGRAGQAGVAYSLVAPSDVTVFHALGKFYKLELHTRDLPAEQVIRAGMADHLLADRLSTLDAAGTLEYGPWISVARRLTEREDGARVVAKLIAHFVATSADGATTTNGAARSRPAVAAPPMNGVHAAPAAESTPAPAERPPKPLAPAAAAAEVPPAEAAPAAPRRGRTAPPAPADTPSSTPAPAAALAAPETPTFDAFTESLIAAAEMGADRPGRWVGSDELAEAVGAPLAEVEAALAACSRFEPGRKFAGHWRVHRVPFDRSASPPPRREPAPAPAADAAPPTNANGVYSESGRKVRRTRATEGVSIDAAPAPVAAAPPAAEAPAKAEARRSPARRAGAGGPPGRGRGRNGDGPEPRQAPKAMEPARPSAAPAPEPARTFTTLQINLGTRQFAEAAALAAVIIDYAGIDAEDLGLVALSERGADVQVADAYAVDVARALNGFEIAGVKVQVSGLKFAKERPDRGHRGRR